jgi:hypothetical protein
VCPLNDRTYQKHANCSPNRMFQNLWGKISTLELVRWGFNSQVWNLLCELGQIPSFVWAWVSSFIKSEPKYNIAELLWRKSKTVLITYSSYWDITDLLSILFFLDILSSSSPEKFLDKDVFIKGSCFLLFCTS